MSELEIRDAYAPPMAESLPVMARHEVRAVIVAWERLRIIYNVVLLVAGVGAISLWEFLGMVPVLLGVVGVGIGANACFFAGPLAELYSMGIRRSGPWKSSGRWLVFGGGLGFSLCLFALISMA